MCVMSAIHDHYQPLIPNPVVPQQQWTGITWPPFDVAEMRKLIAEFREAVEMAKKLDTLMKQPDCVDPKKATLVERVAQLEARCAQLEGIVGGMP